MESSEAIQVIQKIIRNEGINKLQLGGVIICIEQLEKELAELKSKLENAIVPKYKIGQEVIYNAKYLHKFKIDKRIIDKNGKLKYESIGFRQFDESELFATREDAQASLVKGK
jgi:hypothetical protein